MSHLVTPDNRYWVWYAEREFNGELLELGKIVEMEWTVNCPTHGIQKQTFGLQIIGLTPIEGTTLVMLVGVTEMAAVVIEADVTGYLGGLS